MTTSQPPTAAAVAPTSDQPGAQAYSVRRDEHPARALAVTGVPFAVFAGNLAVRGTTSTDGSAQARSQARELG